MNTSKLNNFSTYEIAKSSTITIQGGSGTITVLDTDMESVVE